ncbi:response regulator transcription factor [Cupriavidus basilensis]|uniref:Response regulator transcription factor n=1 Tax=Cupriavidus basilensis TaxID=68895 RepID=A0ABT6B117_9BURK|nr:response regulator transcription factor [Cupriavidus basilensis]MDF3838576.1 response regulator transcription factor [Cupriavidus basilensis]
MRIAVLEDDPARALVLEQALSLGGLPSVRFREGGSLMQALRHESYDLLLMTWEIPGIPARGVLQWVRRTLGDEFPVMLLSQHGEDDHIARCFALGANAFVTAPVRRAELAARVKALLRRIAPVEKACSDLRLGAYRFALTERRAYVNERQVKLAPKEFELAILLFRHAGQLLLRQTIVEHVWRRAVPPDSRTVDSHLSRVRTKLALAPRNGVRLSAVYATGCRLDLVGQP